MQPNDVLFKKKKLIIQWSIVAEVIKKEYLSTQKPKESQISTLFMRQQNKKAKRIPSIKDNSYILKFDA